jgi:hypothetical protein
MAWPFYFLKGVSNRQADGYPSTKGTKSAATANWLDTFFGVRSRRTNRCQPRDLHSSYECGYISVYDGCAAGMCLPCPMRVAVVLSLLSEPTLIANLVNESVHNVNPSD